MKRLHYFILLIVVLASAQGARAEEIHISSVSDWNTVYNLAGQRLSKPLKGVNIVKGRKLLVR